MDIATGTFVAPRAGKYFFALSGVSNTANIPSCVQLQLNGVSVGRGVSHDLYLTFSLQSVLQLRTGDQIRLFLTDGTIYDDTNAHDTHFVGFLIEEGVFQ